MFKYIGNRKDNWYYIIKERRYPISPNCYINVDEDWITPFVEDKDFEQYSGIIRWED